MPTRSKNPMVKTIPATEARVHFGEVLRRVYKGREQIIVEKDGLEVAAIVSRTDYEEYRQLLALAQLQELNRTINHEIESNSISEEQALADLQLTRNQVFEEQYGRAAKPRRRKAA